MRICDSFGELEVQDNEPIWHHFWGEYAAERWQEDTLERLRARTWYPRKIMVDVGAWIGPVTMWAARLGATVVAIEPDPVSYNALVRNVAANKLTNVTTICAAIAPHSGLLRIRPNPGGQFGNSATQVDDEGLVVAAFSLPRLLRELRIRPEQVQLVKIDIEGYEKKVMSSLRPYLDAHEIELDLSLHPELEPCY